MKLMAIALASVFALSSTYALASTHHHKSGVRTQTHQGSYARNYNYGGGGNNRAGLVGGDDSGTYARAQPQAQTGWNNNGWNSNWNNSYGWSNNGWNNNWNNNYGGSGNNRGGLVGGDDSGTYRR